MKPPFPVESSQTEENTIISAKVYFKRHDSGNDVFYTETFPNGDVEHKFRVKLVYQRSLFIYITYWKPINKSQNAVIKYDVTMGGTKKQLVLQVLFNEWIILNKIAEQIKNSGDMVQSLKLEISNILIESTDPHIQSPNPLLWVSSLVDDSDHSTVDLTGKDSAKVQVLQWALKTNSVVFSRLFCHDSPENLEWREKKERSLEFDLDAEGLREFKAYLYTSAAPKKRGMQIFPVAHMYEMEHLMFCCAEVLYTQLTADNAMDVLKMASHYEYRPLVSALWLYYEEHLSRLDLASKTPVLEATQTYFRQSQEILPQSESSEEEM